MKLIPHCTVTITAKVPATGCWCKGMLNEDHLQISWPQGQTFQLIVLLCTSSASSILSTSFALWALLCNISCHVFQIAVYVKRGTSKQEGDIIWYSALPSCWIMGSSVLLFLTTWYETGFSFSPQPSPLLSFKNMLLSHFCFSCKTVE